MITVHMAEKQCTWRRTSRMTSKIVNPDGWKLLDYAIKRGHSGMSLEAAVSHDHVHAGVRLTQAGVCFGRQVGLMLCLKICKSCLA
jgi:hypothetical protein